MSGTLGPQKRLVAEPSRLLKEHRRQAAAAVVVHSSPVLPPVYLTVSGCRRNSRSAHRSGKFPPSSVAWHRHRVSSTTVSGACARPPQVTTIICIGYRHLLHLQQICSGISP